MTAALSFDPDFHPIAAPLTLAIPAELETLFEESAKVKGSFDDLSDRDRRGFVRYILEAKTGVTRERRAAIVAMSLIGLAR